MKCYVHIQRKLKKTTNNWATHNNLSKNTVAFKCTGKYQVLQACWSNTRQQHCTRTFTNCRRNSEEGNQKKQLQKQESLAPFQSHSLFWEVIQHNLQKINSKTSNSLPVCRHFSYRLLYFSFVSKGNARDGGKGSRSYQEFHEWVIPGSALPQNTPRPSSPKPSCKAALLLLPIYLASQAAVLSSFGKRVVMNTRTQNFLHIQKSLRKWLEKTNLETYTKNPMQLHHCSG